ncbi:hypothetical protein [Actinophytocola sp.]|uniref:hypothetical protein n=1 Tax=Actinophytocola sp. TaxID=1872138 RepID=UPI002D8027F7|nr:hypothetical protein [Actinophytocola sp.]HET9141894.1 hypothetical protein [Actinophytocola sp.]
MGFAMDGTIRARVAGHRATRVLRDVLTVSVLATLGWLLMTLLGSGSAAADNAADETGTPADGLLGSLAGTVETLTGGLFDQAPDAITPLPDQPPVPLPAPDVPPAPANPPAPASDQTALAAQSWSFGGPATGSRAATAPRRPAVIAAAAPATVPTGTAVAPSPPLENEERPGAIPAGPSAPVAPAGGVTCGPDAPGGFVVLSGPDRPEPPAGSAPADRGGSAAGRHPASPTPTPD